MYTRPRCAIVSFLHSVPCAAAFCCYISAWPRPQLTPWTGSPWTSLMDGRALLKDKFAHDATGTSSDRMCTGTFALKTGSWTAESASRWNLHKEHRVGKRAGLACTLYTKSHIKRIYAGTGQSSSSLPSTNASVATAAPTLQEGYACKVFHSSTRLGSCTTASLPHLHPAPAPDSRTA